MNVILKYPWASESRNRRHMSQINRSTKGSRFDKRVTSLTVRSLNKSFRRALDEFVQDKTLYAQAGIN